MRWSPTPQCSRWCCGWWCCPSAGNFQVGVAGRGGSELSRVLGVGARGKQSEAEEDDGTISFLKEQAWKLDQIVFHEKLGTVADKVERVAKLARWLVEEGIVKSPSPLAGEGQDREASQGEGTSRGEQALTLPPGSAGRAPPSPEMGEGQNF